MKRKEIMLLLLVLFISAVPRFMQLGYSHFYGDETKALYTKKSSPPREYLMEQRKGPMQSLVSWTMEKLSGGYDETFTRLPFAVAGLLAVLGLYLFVRGIINIPTALVAALLFSLNGIYIAFSRTVQYQSLLLMFGFFSIWFFYLYAEKKKLLFLIISSVLYAFCILSHYDGIFFVIPMLYILMIHREIPIKHIIAGFILPFILLAGSFYFPYFLGGFFRGKTFTYLYQRALGFYLLPNNSIFTFKTYNPFVVFFIPFLFSIVPFLRKFGKLEIYLLAWFLVPFLIFEFVFSNPGTHIHNYIIPLMVISAYGIYLVYTYLKNNILKTVFTIVISFVLLSMAVLNYFVFLPALNTGYPWKDSYIGPLKLAKVPKDKYQIFIYGFPYNRGWKQVREFLFTSVTEKPRNFSTNDNVTIAEFYLTPLLAFHARPQYYIEVFDNQLDKGLKETVDDPLIYFLEKEFYIEGKLVAKLYRRLI